MQKSNSIILIGYSGHAFVVGEAILAAGGKLAGYCDSGEKVLNPFSIPYFGSERAQENISILQKHNVFISVGHNVIRKKIYDYLHKANIMNFAKAIHPSAVISQSASVESAVLISPNVTLNALVQIGIGTICNTGCIIEHECQIGDFAHIAPGAVLAGNVTVGDRTFIGANSIVKQGVKIGNDVIVGAGSVILKNIPDRTTVIGNPGRIIKLKK